MKRVTILGINGSASPNSSNLSILKVLSKIAGDLFDLHIIDDLTRYPHFNTAFLNENTPEEILNLRDRIAKADGIIISTPEYVFSIPSGLKNLIEWNVSETVFTDKPLGIITASAGGEKGHEELQLIMKTLQSKLSEDTTLLIQGVKGKINSIGEITDQKTKEDLQKFVRSFVKIIPNLEQP